jgi:hypothetical protein
MALDGTYSGLQSAVADHAFRTGDAVFTAAIPDFIRAAEAEMNRRLRVRQMVSVDPAFEITGEFVGLPADFEDAITLILADGSVLDCLPMGLVVNVLWWDNQLQGEPRHYAIVGTQMQLAPVPDQTYAGTLTYYASLPQLSDATPTNWLLTSHPDAYLYGALAKAAPYLDEDARLQSWGGLYEQAIATLNLAYGESFGDRLTMQAPFAP